MRLERIEGQVFRKMMTREVTLEKRYLIGVKALRRNNARAATNK